MEPATSKSEESPKEDSASENLRMGAALAFSFVLLVIGVPLWWKMTEVKRYPLPYSRISALNDVNPTIVINISVHTEDPINSYSVIQGLREHFNQSELFQVNLKPFPLKIKNFNSLDVFSLENVKEIHSNPMNTFLLIETPNFPETEHPIALGAHRTIYFKPSTSAAQIYEVFNRILLQEDEMYDSMKAMVEPGYVSNSSTVRDRVRTSTDYAVIFSVVNPQPELMALKWYIPETLKRYISPLLKQLSELANFHLKSQWLYFIDLGQIPKKITSDEEANHYFVLSDKQLPRIISPLEKKLGSGVSKYPCIHLVLYATPCQYQPLYFQSKDGSRGTNILSARWGGIQLLNGNSSSCEAPVELVPDENQVMLASHSLLRTLFGLQDFSKDVLILSPVSVKLNLWELDFLFRLRSLEQFASARLTLNSLAHLLNRISNIVITEEVGIAVYDSVDAAEKVLDAYLQGDLGEALKFSRITFNQAEFAFTHPSLLALLYFPDDQKYAVYIPLFLPIMIPVLLSIKSVRPWLKEKLTARLKDSKKTD